MGDITQLPSELLLKIAGYLNPADISNLMRTSKRFAEIGRVAIATDQINYLTGLEKQLADFKKDFDSFAAMSAKIKRGMQVHKSWLDTTKKHWADLKATLAQLSAGAQKIHFAPGTHEAVGKLLAKIREDLNYLEVRAKVIDKIMAGWTAI